MATQQQIIDAKYDIVRAEQEQKIREIFDENIIGFFLKNNLRTFEEITNYTGNINLDGRGLTSIKGLNYLNKLEGIFNVSKNNLIEIDVTSLVKTSRLVLNTNLQLLKIGDVSNLLLCEKIYLSATSLDINSIDNLLKQAKLLKQNAGVLNLLDLSANVAPSNGAQNSEYIWLGNNGVVVTINI